MKRHIPLLLAMALFNHPPAEAYSTDGNSVRAESTTPNAPHSKWGMYGTALGDPGLNVFGINLVYQNDDIFANFSKKT